MVGRHKNWSVVNRFGAETETPPTGGPESPPATPVGPALVQEDLKELSAIQEIFKGGRKETKARAAREALKNSLISFLWNFP